MPINMLIDNTAIISIVEAAFFAAGGLKAGTPFETASTPVMAVQPFENAVSSRNRVSGVPDGSSGANAWAGCTAPLIARQAPTAMSASTLTTKKYVGTEKMRPDSR